MKASGVTGEPAEWVVRPGGERVAAGHSDSRAEERAQAECPGAAPPTPTARRSRRAPPTVEVRLLSAE